MMVGRGALIWRQTARCLCSALGARALFLSLSLSLSLCLFLSARAAAALRAEHAQREHDWRPRACPHKTRGTEASCWTLLSTKIGEVTLMRPIHGNL